MSNEIMRSSDIFMRISHFLISLKKTWEKQMISLNIFIIDQYWVDDQVHRHRFENQILSAICLLMYFSWINQKPCDLFFSAQTPFLQIHQDFHDFKFYNKYLTMFTYIYIYLPHSDCNDEIRNFPHILAL